MYLLAGDVIHSVLVTGERVLSVLPYFAIILLGWFVAKVVYDKFQSDIKFDEELTTNDNPAFGAHFALFLLGVAIALNGLLFGSGEPSFAGMLNALIYGPIVIVLFLASVKINDKLILSKFSIYDEMIKNRNIGTAFVVGGSCVATGLILDGALRGESASLVRGLIDLAVYWIIGQALLVLGGWVFQLITSYDVHAVIGDDKNTAAGVSFGGFLVAIGIINRQSIIGAGSDLTAEIATTIVISVFGLILLVLARVIADKVLLPKSPLSHEISIDKNVGAGAVAAAAFVSISLAFSSALGS